MSIKIIESAILKRASGEEIAISPEEKQSVRSNNTITVTCDGPRCQQNNGTESPLTLTFSDEDVRTKVAGLPDAFWRFIRVQPYPDQETMRDFCSRRCVTDFFVYEYVLPLSPREKAEQAAGNQIVEAIKQSRFEEPVTQADGEAGEMIL